MFKDLLKDVYDESVIKILELTENFDSIYIRKDEKRNKLNIILPYKNYNIIIEFIVNNKALVGNIFDNSTYEQLYQFDMPFVNLRSIIEMFYSLFDFIKKIYQSVMEDFNLFNTEFNREISKLEYLELTEDEIKNRFLNSMKILKKHIKYIPSFNSINVKKNLDNSTIYFNYVIKDKDQIKLDIHINLSFNIKYNDISVSVLDIPNNYTIYSVTIREDEPVTFRDITEIFEYLYNDVAIKYYNEKIDDIFGS
jgi:hypothetical protein